MGGPSRNSGLLPSTLGGWVSVQRTKTRPVNERWTDRFAATESALSRRRAGSEVVIVLRGGRACRYYRDKQIERWRRFNRVEIRCGKTSLLRARTRTSSNSAEGYIAGLTTIVWPVSCIGCCTCSTYCLPYYCTDAAYRACHRSQSCPSKDPNLQGSC
jgi:hypothetical protein